MQDKPGIIFNICRYLGNYVITWYFFYIGKHLIVSLWIILLDIDIGWWLCWGCIKDYRWQITMCDGLCVMDRVSLTSFKEGTNQSCGVHQNIHYNNIMHQNWDWENFVLFVLENFWSACITSNEKHNHINCMFLWTIEHLVILYEWLHALSTTESL